MQARSILETCLYVDDLEQAEDFYVRILGLTPFAREKGRHVFFHCGNSVFLLFNPAATVHSHHGIPPHGAHGRGHAAFRMNQTEINAWRAHLKETPELVVRGGHGHPDRDMRYPL